MDLQQAQMTRETFWEEYAFKPYELIDGQPVKVQSPGFKPSVILMRIEDSLTRHAEAHDLGEVVGALCPFGIKDDTLYQPRAAFISKANWRSIRYPYKYLPFAPDLSVEMVRSKQEQAAMRRRIKHYFQAGTQYVWVVYPDPQRVGVYHRSGKSKIFDTGGTLYGGKTLPGLELPVASIFPSRKSSPKEA